MKPQQYGLLLTLFCVFLLAWPTTMFGAEGWEARLKVSAAGTENNLSFGQRADASMEVDGRYDVPALLSGTLKAYFLLSGGQLLWRDIRPLNNGDAQSLSLWIETQIPGQTVSLSWNKTDFPAGSRVELLDVTGQVRVDMLRRGDYIFTSEAGPRQFNLLLQ